MDKIIEAILDLLPFSKWLIKAGLSEKQSAGLSVLITVALVYLCSQGIKKLIAHRENTKAAKKLVDFKEKEITNRRLNFIETQFQNLPPTIEDELKAGTHNIAKRPLIKHLLKNAFDDTKESNRFYLILADSGMGKTTFMINLYMQYYSFWNFKRPYEMKLLPFGDKDIINKLKKIASDPEKAKNTILLLDAFDEYSALSPEDDSDGLSSDDRFREKLDEIIDLVKYCRKVVITGRPQYFPGQEKQDYTLKIKKYSEDGYHVLVKYYLSPFNMTEIERFLNKKFGRFKFWNKGKKEIANRIILRSPKLMVRPMLLGHIDLLIEKETELNGTNTYQTYEILINEWLRREAKKREHENTSREEFMNDLLRFSHLAALKINKNRKEWEQLSITERDANDICNKHQINIMDYQITGQSLLTRDGLSNWKFAHKSILEFFLAKEAIENFDFHLSLDFTGMDMVKLFCKEKGLGDFVLIKGGTFLMGSPEDEVDRNEKDETQHEVKLRDFYMSEYTVALVQFEAFIQATNYQTDADKSGSSRIWNEEEWKDEKGVNWKCDVFGKVQIDKQHPVIHVSWNDAKAYAKWLSEKHNRQYDLPTEAQWEYACRAGTATTFNTGGNLTTEQGNYNGNYPYNGNVKGKYLEKIAPVGTYEPNDFGLYDMHGNVWEWCSDWYGEKYYEACKMLGIVENPVGAKKGDDKVLRGGSWDDSAQYCRSAFRCSNAPDYRHIYIGFRLVCSPAQQ